MIDSLGQQACFLIDSLTSQKPDDDLWVMGKKKTDAEGEDQRGRVKAGAVQERRLRRRLLVEGEMAGPEEDEDETRAGSNKFKLSLSSSGGSSSSSCSE